MAKVLETAQSLAEALTTLETHLHTLPLFRPGVNAAEFLSHLTKQELAQLNVALSYACYSLVWIYLRANGVPPASYNIKNELQRVHQYMSKLKELTTPKESPLLRIDKDATRRMIVHGLSATSDSPAANSSPDVAPASTPASQGSASNSVAVPSAGKRKRGPSSAQEGSELHPPKRRNSPQDLQ